MPTPPRVLPLILWLALAPTQPGLAGGHRGSDTSEAPASSPAARLLSERASPRQVGAVMALLATFEEAGALPPESSPDANRLIKALIQFQAAFMKSRAPALQGLLDQALAAKLGDQASTESARLHSQGWSSRSLEALVEYAMSPDVWERPGIADALRAFNVGRSDFDLVARTFLSARDRFAARGEDLHAVYAARRRAMPGGGL